MTIRWYAGADHAGFALKRALVEQLRGLGDEVIDLGTDSEQSVDYPDYGAMVGRKVSGDPGSFGLLVCGTGIGVSIAANKIAGVRAAVVTDSFTAAATRAHNDANVIAFGSRVVGPGLAQAALQAFRATPFEGGRHARRVDKIRELEQGGPSGGTGSGETKT
jgi:ribose 5-phosphate isomerase B